MGLNLNHAQTPARRSRRGRRFFPGRQPLPPSGAGRFSAGSGVLRRGNPAGPAGRPGVDRRHGKETAGRSALRGFASFAAASAFWGRPAIFTGGGAFDARARQAAAFRNGPAFLAGGGAFGAGTRQAAAFRNGPAFLAGGGAFGAGTRQAAAFRNGPTFLAGGGAFDVGTCKLGRTLPPSGAGRRFWPAAGPLPLFRKKKRRGSPAALSVC